MEFEPGHESGSVQLFRNMRGAQGADSPEVTPAGVMPMNSTGGAEARPIQATAIVSTVQSTRKCDLTKITNFKIREVLVNCVQKLRRNRRETVEKLSRNYREIVERYQ